MMWRKLLAIVLLWVITSGLTFGITVGPSLKPTRGARLNINHPLTKGLVGYWPMNEGAGNIIRDISGHGRHGSCVNGPVWVSAPYGKALQFTASSDQYINLGYFPLNTNAISFWCLYLSTAVATDQTLYGSFDAGSTASFVRIRGGQSRPQFAYGDGATLDYLGNSSTWLPVADTYHSIAFAISGGSGTFWADGILEDSDSDDNHNPVHPAAQDVWLAAYNNNGSVDDPLDGIMVAAALWNRALTPSEIQQLYADPWCIIARPSHEMMYAEAGGEPPATHPQVIIISSLPLVLIVGLAIAMSRSTMRE